MRLPEALRHGHHHLSHEAHLTSCEIQSRLEGYTPNYTRWIVRQARLYAGSRLLDIGCSMGNVTRNFIDRELVVGIDPNPHAIARAREAWAGQPNVKLFEMAVPSEEFLGLAQFEFDSAMCLNVLEHVRDDGEALRQIHAVLQPGASLFLLVPANPWLYGSMDAADHHYRRYTRATLGQAVEQAGFHLRSMWAMNAVGMLGWWINGRVLRRSLIPSNQAGLYDRCIPILARLEARFHPPLGQSLVVVADR